MQYLRKIKVNSKICDEQNIKIINVEPVLLNIPFALGSSMTHRDAGSLPWLSS